MTDTMLWLYVGQIFLLFLIILCLTGNTERLKEENSRLRKNLEELIERRTDAEASHK